MPKSDDELTPQDRRDRVASLIVRAALRRLRAERTAGSVAPQKLPKLADSSLESGRDPRLTGRSETGS